MAFDPRTVTDASPLGLKQELFSWLQSVWVTGVYVRGWRLRQGEGRILQLGPEGTGRQAQRIGQQGLISVRDRVHMEGSLHYMGLAVDWNLFVDGKWVTSCDSQAWQILGKVWESLHPLCAWGGRFRSVDCNHLSIRHDGRG